MYGIVVFFVLFFGSGFPMSVNSVLICVCKLNRDKGGGKEGLKQADISNLTE